MMRTLLFSSAILVVGGCVASTEPVESSTEAVVSEHLACSNPEVGQLTSNAFLTNGRPFGGTSLLPGSQLCTATLIAEDVLLTSAHCVHYVSCPNGLSACRSTLGGGPYYTPQTLQFEIAFRPGAGGGTAPQVYEAAAVASIGGEQADLAIIRLAQRVPASVAVPAPLAASAPPAETELFLFGYGCNDRSSQSGVGVRRLAIVRVGRPTNAGCPGDSGGPNLDAQGRLVRVNKAIAGNDTFFANPLPLRARIEQQIRTWGAAPLRAAGSSGTRPLRPQECGSQPIDPGGGPVDPIVDNPGGGGTCGPRDPGTCVDEVFGQDVCNGGRGYRQCTTNVDDPQRLLAAQCTCSNGRWSCPCGSGAMSTMCEPDPTQCRWIDTMQGGSGGRRPGGCAVGGDTGPAWIGWLAIAGAIVAVRRRRVG